MNLIEFATLAIGVPFVIGGREFTGWDCWGLVYVAYRDVFNIGIGRFDDEYTENVTFNELAALISREKPAWSEVDQPMPGDISLYRVGRYESHIGLVLPGNRLLHCEAKINTVHEPLNTPVWKNRHVGYYRHTDRP